MESVLDPTSADAQLEYPGSTVKLAGGRDQHARNLAKGAFVCLITSVTALRDGMGNSVLVGRNTVVPVIAVPPKEGGESSSGIAIIPSPP